MSELKVNSKIERSQRKEPKMILTGEAAKFAEEFEELSEKCGSEDQELDEQDQVILFFATQMYKKDKFFRGFMKFFVRVFSKVMVTGEKEYFVEKMKEISEHFGIYIV